VAVVVVREHPRPLVSFFTVSIELIGLNVQTGGIYPDPINWTKDDHRRPTSFVAYVWDEKSQSIKRITDWAKYKDGEPVVAKMTN